MNNRILIRKDKLPDSEQDAIELIYEYFNGFDIKYYCKEEYYEILLQRSDFAYCEDVTEGLNSIGVAKGCLDEYCLITSNACLCLSENWIPYAWSILSPKDTYRRNKLAIIHVDYHTDLMSPFISYNSGQYYNMLNGKSINFFDMSSMEDAVKSGAVTIGSMLTSILYSLQSANVYHVKQDVKKKVSTIKKVFAHDSFFAETEKRIKISFSEDYEGGNRYVLTSNWDLIIRHLANEEECILHIDMDYFNNRFNGSTSWKTDNLCNDPPFEEQKKHMDELCSSIKIINQCTTIRYILIGVSPSFYPAEYWKIGLNYILKGLKNAGLDVQELIDGITGVK